MRWRLLRLNWRYAIGELAIVVVGVLIAFAVNEWNSSRLDRVEEVEIVDRLIDDLQTDIEVIEFGVERISMKQERLERIQSLLEVPELSLREKTNLLTDVVEGAALGWNQMRARRTTYDEILMSGKFSLIRSAQIRVQISDYYVSDATSSNRIEERETGYADLSYALVPRATEFEVAKGLSEEDIERLVDNIYVSALPDHIVGERNFAQFLSEQFEGWGTQCRQLIEALEAYRGSIE